jgi:hypothetical protein
MNIQKILDNPRFRLQRGRPAESAAVDQFLQGAPSNLPVKYLQFMRACDGAKGDIPYDSGYIEIWSLEEALEKQAGYGIQDSLPGFFAFAADGSDRIFLFDLREEDGAPVLSVSTEKLGEESFEEIAPSFSQFLEHITLMRGGY